MYAILIAAIVLIRVVGLVLPLADPQGKSALTRAAVAVFVDSRIADQARPWPERIFRWIVFVVALIGIVLIVANFGALVDWFTGAPIFDGSR